MNLNVILTKDQSQALLNMRDGATRIMPRLAQAFHAGALEILGRAVKNRFTGKGPFPPAQNRLGVVTNRLRKSLRVTALQVDAATGQMSISMGSNVSYYAAHEFGFRGLVKVKGHTRRAVAERRRNNRGRITKAEIKSRKDALRSGRGSSSFVKPHSRRVNIPARRPLGTELANIQTRLTLRKRLISVLTRYLKTP